MVDLSAGLFLLLFSLSSSSLLLSSSRNWVRSASYLHTVSLVQMFSNQFSCDIYT